MNRLLLTLSLWCVLDVVIAQEPKFLQHNTADENAGVPINTMLQDHQCMIWLGTDQGLVRYDGNAWHPISLDTTSPSMVTSLMEDHEGKIWVGTSSGKIFYLDASRKVSPFNIQEGNPAKPVTSILQDLNGQIWFATYGEGVYVYTGYRLYNINVDDGLSANDIYDMTLTADGETWIGTDDGISACFFEGEKKKIRKIGLAEGLPDQIITTLESDYDGNIWIGTFENGIVHFDPTLNHFTVPSDSQGMDEITAIEIFDGNEIWIGTRKSGVWRYQPDIKLVRSLASLNESFPGEVSDLMTDVEGNIWVTMEEGNLLSAFRPFETLSTDIGEIQTLFCDHTDNLWIGSKKGLYKLVNKEKATTSIIRVAPQYDFNITDIIEDRFHNLWIGTIDKGLYLYQPQSGRVKQVSAEKLKENTIMSMAATNKEIWVASLQGVIWYPADQNIFNDNNVTFNLISDPWQSSLHFVFQVFVDSKDRAWFGTDGNGVYCIDGDKVVQHKGNDEVPIRTVYSICEDQSGHLWFNTADVGLVEFDGENYKPLGLSEGLGNINIASIAMSGTGDLIISHRRGIDLLETERRHFMYYTDEAGVEAIEPGFNSVATNSKGHVFISGKDLIVKYYATQHALSIHPRTQLTRVAVYEQPIDYSVVNDFAYNQNYISFDYVGLWYSNPGSVNYQYKLEGYDRQWKESKDNTASYSNLAPGTYTFAVKASENKFFLDEPLTTYTFTIAKPFWLQYWFITSIILLSGALLYMIIKARERRSERQAIMKKDMIESQLQALKAQINPHFLFNSFNTLITIIDENSDNPDVAIEYVEKLSDFFRSILQYREQETISLEEEWELVQNFGYLLKKRYGPNLRLHMETPPKDAYILPMTLQMLVENAVKHNVITEKRPLDVYISSDNGKYVIVKNNLQPKSKTEPSTQFGLQSIIRRYQHMSDRKVLIEESGDFFEVHIPIIKRQANENSHH